jgi:hypothetical protein
MMMKRRDFLKHAGIGSATLAALPAAAHGLTGPAVAPPPRDSAAAPGSTFSVLLSGVYKPVGKCPDLGLLQVNVCDGSYSTVPIYSISGLPFGQGAQFTHDNRPGNRDCDTSNPIGHFYVAIGGDPHVAYDLPQGALTMVFTGQNAQFAPDGQGGNYLVGTFNLDIVEATGIYQPFIGGHNQMVDILHIQSNGSFVEHCICVVTRP